MPSPAAKKLLLPAWLGAAFATPAPGPGPAPRERVLLWAVGGLLGAWLLTYKLTVFFGLGYTSDLFQFAQLATSWLDGRFLVDNCYGNHLSIHTYFLTPLLSVLVLPFGPAGLLLALALACTASVAAIATILRQYQVPVGHAIPWGVLVTAMPLSAHVYQDTIYGFHVELLIPALTLWLGCFLLRRHWPGALLLAAALLAVKEDAPLLVAAVGAAVLAEDLVRRAAGKDGGRGWRAACNFPALVVIAAAVVALPLLLQVLASHPPTGNSPGSFGRIRPIEDLAVDRPTSLLGYFLADAGAWLESGQVSVWLRLCLLGSFGFALLRPHFFAIGLVTTVVGWLMQDDLTWAPRFSPALGFIQLAATLGFASAWHVHAGLGRKGFARAACLVVVVAGLVFQVREFPRTAEVYLLRPRLEISASDRKTADKLFAQYARERKPGEAVATTTNLFRYADYRSLYWLGRPAGRPALTWVLMEYGTPVSSTTRYEDYRLVAFAGRFAIFRHEPPAGGTR